jgi:hypothetical protein
MAGCGWVVVVVTAAEGAVAGAGVVDTGMVAVVVGVVVAVGAVVVGELTEAVTG